MFFCDEPSGHEEALLLVDFNENVEDLSELLWNLVLGHLKLAPHSLERFQGLFKVMGFPFWFHVFRATFSLLLVLRNDFSHLGVHLILLLDGGTEYIYILVFAQIEKDVELVQEGAVAESLVEAGAPEVVSTYEV